MVRSLKASSVIFLKGALSQRRFYRNVDLVAKAQHATGYISIYVTMPDVVNSLREKKTNLDDDFETAKKPSTCFFLAMDTDGSLVDLVVGEHTTLFPSDFVGMWAKNPNDVTASDSRKDRSSSGEV